MGKVEQRAKKKRQRANVQRLVLGTLAVSGAVSIALVAPNVIGAMVKLGIIPVQRQNEIIKRAWERLIRKGLIVRRGASLIVTAAGKREIVRLSLLTDGLSKPRRWDGRWRVLIFDIPEKRHSTRDVLRRYLISCGFRLLQGSVWVYPYDCEDVIVLLKTELRLGPSMLYLVVEEMELGDTLRREFDLH
jgi:DNA-binding transcriptional regulator PaaX